MRAHDCHEARFMVINISYLIKTLVYTLIFLLCHTKRYDYKLDKRIEGHLLYYFHQF